jgi:hypothetical protein
VDEEFNHGTGVQGRSGDLYLEGVSSRPQDMPRSELLANLVRDCGVPPLTWIIFSLINILVHGALWNCEGLCRGLVLW